MSDALEPIEVDPGEDIETFRTLLLFRIQEWLMGGLVPSDGGWAPVSDKDFEALQTLVYDLIRCRWQADPDHDLPVEFQLVNRTTHHRLRYHPVPYGAMSKGVENLSSPEAIEVDLAAADVAELNLSQAQSDFGSHKRWLFNTMKRMAREIKGS